MNAKIEDLCSLEDSFVLECFIHGSSTVFYQLPSQFGCHLTDKQELSPRVAGSVQFFIRQLENLLNELKAMFESCPLKLLLYDRDGNG